MLRQQREEDVSGLTAEVGLMRAKIRDAEQEVLKMRAEQQVGGVI